MNALQTIYKEYVRLFGDEISHDTAAVRGAEGQPTTPDFSRAAPHFP